MVLDSDGTERMVRLLRHRLLNIVSGVKSANSLLASELDDRLTAREREYFPLIDRECDQVCAMVDRIEALFGALPKPKPALLPSAVPSIMSDLRQICPMAEIQLEVDDSDSERLVCKQTLETVLKEAVLNACEISRKPVTVSICEIKDGISVRVIDQGKVLSEDVREMAFEPFYSTRTRHLGVGLSIAKRLVEDRGGTISIRGEADGNCVAFFLPDMGFGER
ncbi:HAMP domain-containing sensor histidine kinase [Pontiellaceae bacterium B1224]|nr:HAMP domain-containing sensor histidine kinase [Pontiellaceae bacterium B1224]